MKKIRTEALQAAFVAPAPQRKEAFLRTLPGQPIGLPQFLLRQVRYLPLPTVLLSVGGFLLAALFRPFLGTESLCSAPR